MKLSKRLKYIADLIEDCRYQHIYDTCCDHGYLGMSIAGKNPNVEVFLLDVNFNIVENLKQKVTQQNIKTLCLDAALIEVGIKKSLVILAGIGGELAAKIIKEILQNALSPSTLDFIVAANNKNFHVRHELSKLGYRSYKESLIIDKNIGYEIIFSKFMIGDVFDLAGEKMIDLKDLDHRLYIQKQKELYFTKAKFDHSFKNLADCYEKILNKFLI